MAWQSALAAPVGLAFDGSGRLLIGERDGQVVRRLAGGILTLVGGTGSRGGGPGALDDPSGLVLTGVALFVADTGTGSIVELTVEG